MSSDTWECEGKYKHHSILYLWVIHWLKKTDLISKNKKINPSHYCLADFIALSCEFITVTEITKIRIYMFTYHRKCELLWAKTVK